MDLSDIKRKALASRRFVVQLADRAFTLQLPTRHEVEIEAVRRRLHDGEVDPAQMTIIRRRLLERSVVEWSGVTCEQLAAGAGAEPAEVSPEAVALLLDADPALADRLDAEFVTRVAERNAARAQAEKN